jgi:hypothetical protein
MLRFLEQAVPWSGTSNEIRATTSIDVSQLLSTMSVKKIDVIFAQHT